MLRRKTRRPQLRRGPAVAGGAKSRSPSTRVDRRVELVASTANPNGDWVAQQARNLLMLLDDRKQSFRFLLHDHDSKFGGGFDQIVRSEGMTIVRTPVRAPNANA
jgi:hypothetical protein